jgi:hypothetical protein
MEQLTQNSLKRDVLEAQEKLEVDLEKVNFFDSRCKNFQIKDLVQKMKDPVRGVEIKNRRYYFSLHKKCFVGIFKNCLPRLTFDFRLRSCYLDNYEWLCKKPSRSGRNRKFGYESRAFLSCCPVIEISSPLIFSDQPFRNGNFWYSFVNVIFLFIIYPNLE